MMNERQKELVKAFKALTDEQRAAFVKKAGAVITTDGHPLSGNNTVLCIMQRGDKPLSMVGGFHQWKEHGRRVKRGENGMGIFFPCHTKAKDADGEAVTDENGEEKTSRYFRIGYVWDISQTEEIPATEAVVK